MTPKDIKSAERNYWIAAPFSILPLMLLAYGGKSKLIAGWLAETLNSLGIPITASNASLILLGAALVFTFAIILLAQYKLLAKCPSCHKAFTPNKSGIVIATKHCPNCGAQVIDAMSGREHR